MKPSSHVLKSLGVMAWSSLTLLLFFDFSIHVAGAGADRTEREVALVVIGHLQECFYLCAQERYVCVCVCVPLDHVWVGML